TVTGKLVGAVVLKGTAPGAGAGSLLSFNVIHAGPDHVDLSGAPTDLTAGADRVVTGTIKDLNGNTVTDSVLSVTFAYDATTGAGTPSGRTSAAAAPRSSAHTVTGKLVGAVVLKGTAPGAGAGSLLSFNVIHAGPDHV